MLLCEVPLQDTGEKERERRRRVPHGPVLRVPVFRDVYINIYIVCDNNFNRHACKEDGDMLPCGGEQSGRASEKKGHGGGPWIVVPSRGLEQRAGSRVPVCSNAEGTSGELLKM